MNVGRTYKNLKMYDEAEQAYLTAKNLFPPVIPGIKTCSIKFYINGIS